MDVNVSVEKNSSKTFYANVVDLQDYHNISGCPMGRGIDQTSAVNDLVFRIELESHITIIPRVVRFNDWTTR